MSMCARVRPSLCNVNRCIMCVANKTCKLAGECASARQRVIFKFVLAVYLTNNRKSVIPLINIIMSKKSTRVVVYLSGSAASLSAHDESPRVSAALGREGAVRCHLATR